MHRRLVRLVRAGAPATTARKMNKLFPATLVIRRDEPCFNLSELNQLSSGLNQALHRFQVIIVVRDDRLAEYRVDLGPAGAFNRPEFRIPGGVVVGHGRIEILHTVAELMEIADNLRNTPFALPFAPADLTKEYYDYLDELPRLRKAQSTFGPEHKLVRAR